MIENSPEKRKKRQLPPRFPVASHHQTWVELAWALLRKTETPRAGRSQAFFGTHVYHDQAFFLASEGKLQRLSRHLSRICCSKPTVAATRRKNEKKVKQNGTAAMMFLQVAMHWEVHDEDLIKGEGFVTWKRAVFVVCACCNFYKHLKLV